MTESSTSLPDAVVGGIRSLIRDAGIAADTDLVARILETGVGLGLDETDRLDLEITSAALEEMRGAFRLFAPYRDVPKVTVFGSARTTPSDPLFAAAREAAAALAQRGWMIVTGAGPGIMLAATEGAGTQHALGVSIRLPFEQQHNAVLAEPNVVTMKYFFTRKLMLIKESQGFVVLPGGFGTLDEMFELLTLQQTGKAEPVPIVLLDAPGGTFWAGLERFVNEHLEPAGLISRGDLDRVLMTDSVERAAAEITGFWRNYDSLRWVGDKLILRLNAEPTDAEIAHLNTEFAGLLAAGRIERSAPLPVEVRDADRLDHPRITLTLEPRRVGALHTLIRAINGLGTAPAAATPPDQAAGER